MPKAGASDHSPIRLTIVCCENLFSRRSFIALVLSLYVVIRRDFGTDISPRVRTLIAARKAGPVSTCYMAAGNVDGIEKQGLVRKPKQQQHAAFCLRTRIPGLLSALYNQPVA